MHPTEQQVADALRVVRYEMEQLLGCYRFKPRIRAERNMRLESFLLHYRVLLDFFARGHERKDDDVLAADFGYRSEGVAMPAKERSRLNKDLAHLTYSRLNRKNKEWDLDKLMGAMLPRCAEFARHLLGEPPELSGKDELARWEELLRDLDIAALEQPGAERTSGTPDTSTLGASAGLASATAARGPQRN